jgi:hypothetical protein
MRGQKMTKLKQACDAIEQAIGYVQLAQDEIDEAIRLGVIPQDILSLSQELRQVVYGLKQVLEGK